MFGVGFGGVVAVGGCPLVFLIKLGNTRIQGSVMLTMEKKHSIPRRLLG